MNEEIKNDTEVVDNTTTESTNEVVDEKASFNPQEYSVIRDMMKEMDEWNAMLKNETHSILKNSYGLTNFAIVGIIPYNDEKIESMTIEEIKSFIEKYRDENVTHLPEITNLEDGIKMMKDIKELQMNLYTADQEANKLKEQSQDILNDYFEYLSSPEVLEARRKRLEKMKELAENETDEVKKIEMIKMISSMEQSDNMEFIFKRFYDDAQKETKSVLNAFFDEKRGNYIIDRYKTRITRFGFDVNIYKYFFNLEENFLSEKYHAFNNLFLFYYMRFVGYADRYNKIDRLFVQSLTSGLANMIYHKFNSKIEEQKFIHIIEKFEDYFMDEYDYFMVYNTTRPGHPVREQASAKYEADQKERLIAKMDELGISGYDNTWTSKQMHEFFNQKMDEILEEQKKEREAKAVVSTNDDGSITITPDTSDDNEIPTVTSGYISIDDVDETPIDNVTTTTSVEG